MDGVFVINQASAMAAGGFPFTIFQPGSYSGHVTGFSAEVEGFLGNGLVEEIHAACTGC